MLPFVGGDVGKQLLLGDARVAHQHIHPAQRLFRRAERHLTAGAGGHIALDGDAARQLLLQRCRRVGIGVVEHRHAVSGLIKGSCRRRTDAPVAAGDQHTPHRRRFRLLRRFRHSGRFGDVCRFRRNRFRCGLPAQLRHHDGRFLIGCRGRRLRLFRLGLLGGCLGHLHRGGVLVRQIECQLKFVIVQESALLSLILCRCQGALRQEKPPTHAPQNIALLISSGQVRSCGVPVDDRVWFRQVSIK